MAANIPSQNTSRDNPYVCQHCGRSFTLGYWRAVAPKFCSGTCRNKARTRLPEERFWENVSKTDGCWVWTGHTDGTGYGQMNVPRPGADRAHRSQHVAAHRFSYELHASPIPEGMMVVQSCGSRLCVRPDHLILTAERSVHPLAERFWPKVRKTETCWLWTGANKGGDWPYGTISSGRSGRLIQAHHVSWEIHHGAPVPSGICVLHKCDVPSCVNPDHLFLGALADNTADMVSKGRARGGRPIGTTLSPESLTSFRRKRGWVD